MLPSRIDDVFYKLLSKETNKIWENTLEEIVKNANSQEFHGQLWIELSNVVKELSFDKLKLFSLKMIKNRNI